MKRALAILLLLPAIVFAQRPTTTKPWLNQITALEDPNADRVLFFDDSAGAFKFASLGSGLMFADTTIGLDADLISLAGITATGSFYYRSADGTWSPVIIGEGLTFLAGTLSAPGGGGGGSGVPTMGGHAGEYLTNDGTTAFWTPQDADLQAISLLNTTSYGRSVLTQANSVSLLSYIGAQAGDSDLSNIAALSTTSYGRTLLTLADGPAVRSHIGATTGTVTTVAGDSGANVGLTLSVATATTTPTLTLGGWLPRIYQTTSEEVDNRLVGKTAGAAAQNLYSTRDNSGSGTYVRSTAHFAADVDFTSVAVYNNGGAASIGVLVSDKHVILAHHSSPANGTTFRFVGRNGITSTRTLSSQTRVGTTDIVVGLLNSAINTIQNIPARVLSAVDETRILAGPLVFVDQTQRLYVADRSLSVTPGYVNIAAPTNATRLALWKNPVSGDSGHPAFALLNGEAVLLGTFHGALQPASIAQNFDAINTVMASLGGGALRPYIPPGRSVNVYDYSGLLSVDGHNRRLQDALGNTVIDYNNHRAYSGTSQAFAWGDASISISDPTTNGLIDLSPDADNEVGISMYDEIVGDLVFRAHPVTGAITSAALSAGGVVRSNAGVLEIATAGTHYVAPTGIDTSAEISALVTDETGSDKLVFNTNPVILHLDAAMAALAIDVTKLENTKTISADSTLTFSTTPAPGAAFGLRLTNSDSAAHTITIPSSYSFTTSSTRNAFTIAASQTIYVIWNYSGSIYYLSGEPAPALAVCANNADALAGTCTPAGAHKAGDFYRTSADPSLVAVVY